jgi:hypothetical protein
MSSHYLSDFVKVEVMNRTIADVIAGNINGVGSEKIAALENLTPDKLVATDHRGAVTAIDLNPASLLPRILPTEMAPNKLVTTDQFGKISPLLDIPASRVKALTTLPANIGLLGTDSDSNITPTNLDGPLKTRLVPTSNTTAGYYLDGNDGFPSFKPLVIPEVDLTEIHTSLAAKQPLINSTTDITANNITGKFSGDGALLSGIPASGVTGLNAQLTSLRTDIDAKQGLITATTAITADKVTANSFSGNGSLLTSIPVASVTGLNTQLTSLNNQVANLQTGLNTKQGLILPTTDIVANNITATTSLSGYGGNITGVPISGVTGLNTQLTSLQTGLSTKQGLITATTDLTANRITASFSGNGALLNNLPISAVNNLQIELDALKNAQGGGGGGGGGSVTIAQVQGLTEQLNAKQPLITSTTDIIANNVTADSFSGSGALLNNLPISAVNNLQIELDALKNAQGGGGGGGGGSVTIAQVQGLTEQLNAKQPLITSTTDIIANNVTADSFSGSGALLNNLPISAVNNLQSDLDTKQGIINATTAQVQELTEQVNAKQPLITSTTDITANNVTADSFSGSGALLNNLPISAVNNLQSDLDTKQGIINATTAQVQELTEQVNAKQPLITSTTDITANNVTADSFSGSGALLTGIPVTGVVSLGTQLSGLSTQVTNLQTALAAKQDLITESTNITANSVTATFSGDGASLNNLPVSAINNLQNELTTLSSNIDSKQPLITPTTNLLLNSITTNGSITVLSDARLKSDIAAIENPLFKIKQLTGCEYNINNHKSAGVLAQDIQQVLPSAVFQRNDGHMSVDYNQVTALLVETCKHLTEAYEAQRCMMSRLLRTLEKDG